MNRYFFLAVTLLIISLPLTGTILAQAKFHNPVFPSPDYDQLQIREDLINQGNPDHKLCIRIRPEILDTGKFSDGSVHEKFLQGQPSTLFQQTGGNWIALGPEGGWVETLLMDPTNHNILYAQCYGWPTPIYKSYDVGSSWQLLSLIPDADISAIAIDPNNSLILYAAYSRYIFKSIDGGLTWNRLQISSSEYPTIADIFVCPTNSNCIYMGDIIMILIKQDWWFTKALIAA